MIRRWVTLVETDVWASLGEWRWWGVVGMAFITASIAIFNVRHGPAPANVWDVFLSVLNNPMEAIILWPVGFLTLLADFSRRDHQGWGVFRWCRAASRVDWWLAKVAAIAVLAGVYTGIVTLVVSLCSLAAVPFAWHWSPLVWAIHWQYTGGLARAWLRVPPPRVGLDVIGLWFAGLWAIGTVLNAVTVWTQTAIGGWLVSVLVALGSYEMWSTHSGLLRWAPMVQVLLQAHSPQLSLAWSWMFDGGMVTAATVVGWLASRRQIWP